MTKEELNDIVQHSEVSRVQFKERIDDNYKIGTELVGAETGIIRAIDEGVEMNFVNDEQIHEFIITIPRKVEDEPANEPAKGESNQVKEPSRHKSNQVTDQVTDQVTNQVTDQVTDQVTGQMTDQVKGRKLFKKDLSGRQKDILNFCSVPRSAAEIMERLSISNHYYNRVRYIQPLVEAGFLKLTNPESPTAPNQKYVKVTKNKS